MTTWPTRTSGTRRAVVAMLATSVVACGTADGAIRLTAPPCLDEGACAEAYEFDGRRYAISSSILTDDDVAERELERLEVADPASIDVLVTTEDPTVIYLRTDDGWLEGEAYG